MSTQQPTAQQVMDAMLAGIYATSMATVKAVEESQDVAFGEGSSRDITLAGGLAATAAQAAEATVSLTQAYKILKDMPSDPPPSPTA